MARVVVNLKKNVAEYSYGYTTLDNDNVTWSDSNIININASGEFYIYVKNKRTELVEKKQRVYILCLGDTPICNINILPFKNMSSCSVSVLPIIKMSPDNVICSINVAPIRNVTICNIEHKIIKLD